MNVDIDKDDEGNSNSNSEEERTISQNCKKSCCDSKRRRKGVLWVVRLVALEGKKNEKLGK